MNARAHIAGGISAGFLLLTASTNGCFGLPQTPPAMAVGVMVSSVLGSLAPDLDSSDSTMGRRALPVSILANALFGHRGLFHRPLFFIALYLVACYIWPQSKIYAQAALAGAISHLILDRIPVRGGVERGASFAVCLLATAIAAGYFRVLLYGI